MWGAWVVQSVKRPSLAQVVIPQFVSSSAALGSVLRAQSLELRAWSLLWILCLLLSLPPPLVLCLSVSQK